MTPLIYSIKLIQAFQASPVGSRTFKLRLMEMTAIACHDLAVFLFQQSDGGRHKGCHTWKRPPIMVHPFGRSEAALVPVPFSDPPPTVFSHDCYRSFEQYPNGVADMVGYWAEFRLFGGVVVFDRGEDEMGVCITSGRYPVTILRCPSLTLTYL